MAHLAIALLGHFEVSLDGRPLTRFRTDKTRALLAYLVVEADRAHRREMLVGLLWPEIPELAAHHNLSQTLFLLRQLLGDQTCASPFFLATRQTLRFNPASDYSLDVEAFQARLAACVQCPPERLSPADAQMLTQAVAGYRGEFLSDPWQVNSPAFEEWRLFKQTQFHLLAVDALDCLGRYHAARGEFALTADYARRQIALEPLREAAHRQLIEALARDGRRPEALAQYAACQAMLAQELGIEPAPETNALYAQIRAERLAKVPPAPREQTGVGQRLSPLAFVGRARELARLDDALALTVAGKGQVVFVTGEAGSGKTALLEAFAQRALAAYTDALIVASSGNAYTGLGDPYWPFIEMLRQLCGLAEGGAALSRSQAHRLTGVYSAIAPLVAACGPDLERFLVGGKPDLEQASLFDQITRALHAVAARYPLILLLDDAQWADRDSLNLLFHLARRLGQRLLIVGAFRSDVLGQSYFSQAYLHEQDADQQHPLARLLSELQCHLGDIQLDLGQAAGREFIDALVDSEPNRLGAEFRETLYRHTSGHALFAAELLRGMQERGDLVRDAQGYWIESAHMVWRMLPARVEGVIAARIGQLLPEWQTMLAVASVEGDEFTVQVLARVLALSEAEISRRLSGALSRHHYLVTPLKVQQVGPHKLARYRFRHLLFQTYLYDRLDPVERAQLHLSVGRALEGLYEERAAEISLPLARHFELGEEIDKAVEYLLQAGQRALHLAAAEEALRLLTRGLTLLQRRAKSPARAQQQAELQLALGNALLVKEWSGPERARAAERAYDLCRRTGDPDQVARSLLMLADVNLARGQLDQVAAASAQLLALAQSTGNSLALGLAHYTLGSVCFFKGQFLQARQYLEQVITLFIPHPSARPAQTGADIGVSSRVWLANALWVMGYADQAVERSQQSIAIARDLGHAFSLGLALCIGELHLRQYRREPQALRAVLQQLADLVGDAQQSFFQLWVRLFQGWLAAVDSHDPAGLVQIRQALDQWEAAGAQGGRIYHYLLLTEAYLALDQVEPALATLEQTLAHIAATGLRFFEAELLRLKGEALRLLARPAEAEECFLRAITVAQAQAAKAWELRAVVSLCRLRQVEGGPSQSEAARQQLAELHAWFREGLDTPDLQAALKVL